MILEPGTWTEVGPGRSVYTPAGAAPRGGPVSDGLTVSAAALARVMRDPLRYMIMWLIYAECATCGAGAKEPCVGQEFGPHEGRPARWETQGDEL
jgi:hypothetical protein